VAPPLDCNRLTTKLASQLLLEFLTAIFEVRAERATPAAARATGD
jgi:hypothetical protein